ncbi:MAG: hypothetical protein HC911_14505 [Chloroflexaceae bacterium]|nr:hypothetical protein [Chloroflexaceae bacterium]
MTATSDTYPDTIIDRIYEENNELVQHLFSEGETTFATNVSADFRKTLLLAIASYFEVRIKEDLTTFITDIVGTDHPLVHLSKRKAIERQYHTYFTWDGNNANTFFALFGDSFKDFMSGEIKRNQELRESIKAFLELGQTRNQIVHQNFAEFTLEKTPEEIYTLYKQARTFVETWPTDLRAFAPTLPATAPRAAEPD